MDIFMTVIFQAYACLKDRGMGTIWANMALSPCWFLAGQPIPGY